MSRNYQRQLALLDTPAGDLRAFKKEGGKIRLYDMGGSPSTPEKTTQVVELPDWAKGYAKDTLAKGAALTDISKNPYQQYGGERIAGFQPLQQRTFETAEQMQPSQQVGLGSSIAGMAGLGALGTNYQGGRFYGGQFNEQAAQDYMDPYAKNVVDYQKAQALRDFQIAQPMRQAQAVKQGAFGGSRSAIIDAEAQRSLNSQLQGIEATGRQAAFQNAQQQFERDQARRLQAQGMGEQSRQYGAGLGMQGLQTGLQAAGQLGQLGQTEYGQRMGITQLQSQLGAQQQQQAQRPLDMAYQDFLNQQNYPYKQLGFMSDMIRGLPLGQQSTQSVYAAPPNLMGQLGGIGMGAYGLSKMGMFDSPTPGKAGGGLAGYADGGEVTSQGNKDAIVDDMYSIEGLQIAKEAALNRRDMDTVAAIDERIAQLNAIQAQSASINYGLGSAFDQIPQERQEEMMAGGGIVAFADGDMVSDPMGTGASEIYDAPVNPNSLSFLQRITNEPAWKAKATTEKPKTAASASAVDASNKTDAMRNASRAAQVKTNDKKVAPAPKQKKLSPALDKAVTKMAEEQGVPKEDFMAMYDKVREKLQNESKEDLKGLQELIDKQSGKSKEIKEKALGKALAEFGFNMAAQASKTGRESKGQGIAGLLGSASAAAPTLAASFAESEKLAAAADANDMKLQMEMRKFNIATRKNDSATAMSAAQNMRILQQQQETIKQAQRQLDETIRANQARENLQRQQIAARSGTAGLRGMQYVARSRAEAMKLAQKEVDSKIRGGMGTVKPEDYDRMLNQAMKKYLPITTGFGMTGISSSKDDDDIIDLD